MDSFLLQQDSADGLNALGFKRDRGVSLALEGSLDMFPGLSNEEPTTMSGMSTNQDSDDEAEGDVGISFAGKRKFSDVGGISDALDHHSVAALSLKMRRIERQGPDVYAVDGQQVPRLQLGESGRAQLKAAISGVLKRRPDLRKQCNAIQKVKNASIGQLLAMARICGIWEQAVKISESFLRRYPCKTTMSSAKTLSGVGSSCGGAMFSEASTGLGSAGGPHSSSSLCSLLDFGEGVGAGGLGCPSLSIL